MSPSKRRVSSQSPTRRSSMNKRTRRTLFLLTVLTVASSVLMILRFHLLMDTLTYETTLPTALRRLTNKRKKRPPPAPQLFLSPVEYNLFQEYNTTSSWKTLPKTQFCGHHARRASQEHGLMAPLSKNSRVVITGLLEPLGVALALRLYKDCGVSTTIGVDALLPNLRVERMKRMQHYAILQKAIPNLPKLIVPEVGLPLDEIIKTHKPTHIVHLYQQRYYQENLLSIQQLCEMLVDEQKLHLVYVSSSADEFSERANQVVASTYHALYGISAVGLRLPEIYGYLDENSVVSQLTMEYLNGNTTNATVLERDCLFVDDAVDALIAGMQFRPTGLSTLSIPSITSASMLSNELSKVIFDKNPKVTTDSTRILGNDQARRWLGWTPSTALQQGVSKLVLLHLAHKYPYGNVEDFNFNLTSFNLTLPLPQRVMFPCASECARRTSCEATVFDEVIKVSKDRTLGCKYVVYAVTLWPNIDDLPSSGRPSSDEPEEGEGKICRIAFVSNKSQLVKRVVANNTRTNNTYSLNGQLQHNNWTLIWVDGGVTTMSEKAKYILPKLSPKRFFSSTVSRAMYVDPFKFPIPAYEHLVRFLKSLDPGPKDSHQKKEYRSRTKIFRFNEIPPQNARRVVFTSLEDMTLGELPPRSPVSVIVKHLVERDGIRTVPSRLQAQQLLYSYAAHLVLTNPRRPEDEIRSSIYPIFPFHWHRTVMMVHDLREEESRQLRCEWYDEHLYWGNSHLEDLSLAYILAKRRIMGQHAPPLEHETQWTPIMIPPVNGQGRFFSVKERLVNAEDMELFIRSIPVPLRETTTNS